MALTELEEKAFPTIDDSMSYEDYVKDLDLTAAEKKELANAYRAQNDAKIAELETKAAINEMTKLTGGEKPEYVDAANQLKKLGDELISLIRSGASNELLNQVAEKMGPICDLMMELSIKK